MKTILSEQLEYEFGSFILQDPIPFDGTIVAVTASGYCPKMNKSLELQLVFYDRNIKFDGYIGVPATCTEVSANGDSEIAIGRVENTTIRRTVTRSQFLGIYVQCKETCPFMPAVDTHVPQLFTFLHDNMISNVDKNNMTMKEFGLQFSFTIEGGEILCMHHETNKDVIFTQRSVKKKAFQL